MKSSAALRRSVKENEKEMAENGTASNANNVGTVESVTGVVIDVRLRRAPARDLLGARDQDPRGGQPPGDGPDLRGAAAPRRRSRARRRDGRDRRDSARRRGDRHRRADHGPRRRGDPGPDLQPARRADRQRRRGQGRDPLADPPLRSLGRGPHPDPGDPRDRDQGRRPARPLREGRQGRPLRRRRRRQDGSDPGADPQHRRGARGPVAPSAASASARARATTSGSR